MKKIAFLVAAALVGMTTQSWGQQQLRRSQFVTNTYYSNPAVAGTEPGLVVSSSFRHQWAGFSGAPTTLLLSGHQALPNGLGVGAIFYNDDMGGAIRQTGVELTGAYSFLLNNQDAVSFGLSLKGNQFVFDGTNLNVLHQGDESLPQAIESTFGVDANAGMMVYGKDYYFGVAVMNLIQDKLNLAGDTSANRMVRHYNFMGSYLYAINKMVSVQPSALIRMTESTPPQLDLYVRAILNGTLWGGLGLRAQDAVVVSLGVNYGAFNVGYNYDITTGDNRLSMHSHEFTFGYYLPRRSAFRSRPSSGRKVRANDRILK